MSYHSLRRTATGLVILAYAMALGCDEPVVTDVAPPPIRTQTTAPSLLATDAFDRANENPIGGNWTSGPGVSADLQLLNNAVKATNDADPNAVAFWNAITWPADQWSEVTIQTRGTSGDAGPAVRIAPTVATYYLAPVFADGRLEIWRALNHSFTRLRAGVPGTVVSGDRIRLEAQGAVLRVFKNGVLVGEVVDGAIAAGAAGIFQDHTSGALDDWAGGAVGSSPPPPSPPAAPTNLAAAAVSASQIDLSWTENATDEDGFRIERCAGAGCSDFVEIATVGANVVSYQNTGLTASTSYSYRVRAYNGTGTSTYSNTATATTPAPPPPGPGPLATDAFNRANENPIAGNWTSGPGVAADLQLLNNAVKATNDADPNAVAFWNAITWPADQWSEVTIQTRGTSGDAGPAVRIAPTVATYYLAPVFADGRLEIWRSINHSFTRLRAGVTGTVVSGDRVRLEAEGSTLRVYKNGVLVGEAVDGAITAGAPGLFQDHTSGVLDDWAGGGFAAAPEPLGRWSSVFPAPIVSLHLHLLPSGKVLGWGFNGPPQVWDPATGGFMAVPAPSHLFCAGHDFLPDGRLLVAGGHIDGSRGRPNTNLFDSESGSWQAGPAMARGRWYPTNTVLPNGEVVTMSGTDENNVLVDVPEVWDGTRWRQLTTARLELEYYPRNFVAPDGRIFYAGEEQPSRWLDVTGTGSWSDGPRRQFNGWRSYGSAVMYEPGKILYVGGGDPPTNTAEIIDLNQPSPTWRFTGSMAYARRHLNATVLPTGEVLVTGGTSGSGFNNPVGATHAAELWNPETGAWTTLASNTVIRIYHSTSVLLPDGRVLHTGSGDGASAANERNYELYSPPYLFRGARPTISSSTPALVSYGQTLFVETPDAANITKVTFIRLGSVTHAFDQAQRLVPLSFSGTTGGLSITVPTSRTAAPPGPYMLFLVTGNGVPSEARIMRLQ